jgi:hypothetical protein
MYRLAWNLARFSLRKFKGGAELLRLVQLLPRLSLHEAQFGVAHIANRRSDRRFRALLKAVNSRGPQLEELKEIRRSIYKIGHGLYLLTGQKDHALKHAVALTAKIMDAHGETVDDLMVLGDALLKVAEMNMDFPWQIPQAQEDVKKCLEIFERLLNSSIALEWGVDSKVARCYGFLSRLEGMKGDMKAALIWAERRTSFCRSRLVNGGHSEIGWQFEIAESLRVQSEILVEMGALDRAREALVESATPYIDRPLPSAFQAVAALRLSSDLFTLFASRGEARSSFYLCKSILRAVHRFTAENAVGVRSSFREHLAFHHLRLLVHTLGAEPSLVPEVILCCYGRKINALVNAEIQSINLAEIPERHAALVDAVLKAQTAVNHLFIEMGESDFGDTGMPFNSYRLEADTFNYADPAFNWIQESRNSSRFVLAWNNYSQALARLRIVRPELLLLSDDSWLPRYEDLQSQLRPTGALLLVLQLPSWRASVTNSRSDFYSDHAAVVLIRPGHAVKVLGLPSLGVVTEVFLGRTKSLNSNGRGGFRFCEQNDESVRSEKGKNQVSTAAECEAAIRQHFWEKLGPELRGIDAMDIVPHGQLHGLPFSLGIPEGIEVSVHPGLIFYWLNKHRSRLQADPERHISSLRYQVYSPTFEAGNISSLSPIPHVYTEADLVGRCWAQRDVLFSGGLADRPATVIHIACHGTLMRRGQEDPCLFLSEDVSISLAELLEGAPSAPIVYLSACLVGRTREDLDGDPLGLVSGFMLRGARCVIAALNPISDFYAPLLAYLFHRNLQAQAEAAQSLNAVAALADAKDQLRSGHWLAKAVRAQARAVWEAQTLSAVIEAYAPRLQQQLEQALSDNETHASIPVTSWNIELMGLLGPLIPALGDTFALASDLSELLEAKLTKSDADTDVAAGRMLAERLVASRSNLYSSTPAVQHLLMDVQAFG